MRSVMSFFLLTSFCVSHINWSSPLEPLPHEEKDLTPQHISLQDSVEEQSVSPGFCHFFHFVCLLALVKSTRKEQMYYWGYLPRVGERSGSSTADYIILLRRTCVWQDELLLLRRRDKVLKQPWSDSLIRGALASPSSDSCFQSSVLQSDGG